MKKKRGNGVENMGNCREKEEREKTGEKGGEKRNGVGMKGQRVGVK